MPPVTTYYLEMLNPAHLVGKQVPEGLNVAECTIPQYKLNRFLYSFIGERWQWTDKLPWTDDQWREYVESGRVRTWVGYCGGAVAGYFELLRNTNDVEIIYFGLATEFIGKGYGGYLLTRAIEEAWAWPGVERVWVHTCTLDHPGALQNYLSRGMTIYKEETDQPA
jgi:RimJ/RimL family protein N-acetyltransferase